MGPWVRIGALLAFAALLPACGANEPAADGPRQPTSTVPATRTVTPAPPTTRTSGPPASTSAASKGNEVEAIAWVPPGPANPANPPPLQWYGLLQRRDCQGILSATYDGPPVPPAGDDDRVRYFWRALGEACLAVATNAEEHWAAAATFRQLSAYDPNGCLDQAADRLLRRLVEAHAQRPARAPTIAAPAPGRTACRPRITAVTVLDEEGNALPPRLRLSGGDLVEIRGEFLVDVTGVSIGGRRAEIHLGKTDEPFDVVVVAPPGEGIGPVRVAVRASSIRVVADGRPLRYVSGEGPPTEGPPTDGPPTAAAPTDPPT